MSVWVWVVLAGCGWWGAVPDSLDTAAVPESTEVPSWTVGGIWSPGAGSRLPAAMGLAASTHNGEHFDRYGSYLAAGIVPARWLGRTGVDADLRVDGTGRELTYVYAPEGNRESINFARTALRDSASGMTASETRLEYGSRLEYSERRKVRRSTAVGWSLLWLRSDESERDMFGVGRYWRPGLLIRIRGNWELHLYADIHAWIGADGRGLQAAVAGGGGMRLVLPWNVDLP